MSKPAIQFALQLDDEPVGRPACSPSLKLVSSGGLAAPVDAGAGASIPLGRRPVHTDANARVRAYRSKLARLDVSIKPEIADTIGEIAAALDCSRNEVMNSLVRFALTNRNWKQVGLYGSKGVQ